MKKTAAIIAGLTMFIASASLAQDGPPSLLLLTNVNVWDGTSDISAPGMNVLAGEVGTEKSVQGGPAWCD